MTAHEHNIILDFMQKIHTELQEHRSLDAKRDEQLLAMRGDIDSLLELRDTLQSNLISTGVKALVGLVVLLGVCITYIQAKVS
jgi:hypothetical protein